MTKSSIAATLTAAFILCVAASSGNAQTQNVLLVPDSVNDRVSAFSAFDGSIVDLDFIVDTTNLDSPVNAIASGRGTIFVSEDDNGVFEYDSSGNLIGNFAGPDQGLGGVGGLETNGDSLFVVSSQGDDSIQEFNLVTGVQSTWATEDDTSALRGSNDILFRENDVLVSAFFSDNIERFDLDGNFLSTFVDGNGDDGIDFPLQIHEASNGDIFAAGLQAPGGIYQYDSDGDLIEFFDVDSVRGVHELDNGNLLFSSAGLGVVVLDLETGVQTEITRGVEIGAWQSIERVTITAVPEPSGVLLVTMVALPMIVRRKRRVGC